jgi:branched-chain amino acid transport system permease protein
MTQTKLGLEVTGPVNGSSKASRWLGGPRLLVGGLILLGIALPSFVSSTLLMTLLTQAVFSALLATAVGSLIRLNGVVSFGHAAFFGMAGYTVALSLKNQWMPAEAAIVLALALPTLLAFVLGLVIVKIPGVAFSMLTLAVGQAFHEFAIKARHATGGDDGLAMNLPSHLFGIQSAVLQRPHMAFLVGWIALSLVLVGLYVLARSPSGRLMEAIRENEERARFIGFETVASRATAFAISAFIAALAGVLFALYNAFVSPDMFHWSLSGTALIMAIIGGPTLIWGPALGAVIIFLFKDAAGNLTDHWQGLIGLTLIVVTVMVPTGLAGVLQRFARYLAVKGGR